MEAHLKKGRDMTYEEKVKNVERVLNLPDYRGKELLTKWKNDSLEKRISRVEKILAFIGAFEKYDE